MNNSTNTSKSKDYDMKSEPENRKIHIHNVVNRKKILYIQNKNKRNKTEDRKT